MMIYGRDFMYEVINRDKGLANKIIQSYSDMMFAGVVAGNNAGRVWVDSLKNPASAIVWSDGLQCFQFMGRETNQIFNQELKAFIEDTIIGFLKDNSLDFFEFSADTEEWYPFIYNALSDREIKQNWQYVYKSEASPQASSKVIIPESYCLHQIDAKFIFSVRNKDTVSNPEFLIDYIEQFWGSVEKYLNLGYGYAAVAEGKIASFAITSFLYDTTFSIGVETLEQHRRKGLASTLVNILLKELYSKGFKIWWDCMDSNIASQKTAQSTGLVLDHKYKVCWFNF
jgi:GNAT superfamily N-acetyltransferase